MTLGGFGVIVGNQFFIMQSRLSISSESLSHSEMCTIAVTMGMFRIVFATALYHNPFKAIRTNLPAL